MLEVSRQCHAHELLEATSTLKEQKDMDADALMHGVIDQSLPRLYPLHLSVFSTDPGLCRLQNAERLK